jgi:spermidine synthase
VIPWKKLDQAILPVPPLGPRGPAPGMQGRTPPTAEMTLWQHDTELVIRIGNIELMSSRQHNSEDELGRLACAHLTRGHVARILIGGLGMGFTLRAVLDAIGPKASVEVAELVPAVVQWNRGILGPLAGHPLHDPRVRLFEGDVNQKITRGANYDAILLDVDNGPAALTAAGNSRLYDRGGLDQLREALRPGGVLAVWSATDDPRFTKRLRGAGFDVLRHHVRARPEAGAIHVLSIATRLTPGALPRDEAPQPSSRRGAGGASARSFGPRGSSAQRASAGPRSFGARADARLDARGRGAGGASAGGGGGAQGRARSEGRPAGAGAGKPSSSRGPGGPRGSGR